MTVPLQAFAKDQWAELNIGPFRVDYDYDQAKARETLADLEQLRWVLGGMLEAKDVEAIWPFRILLTRESGGSEGHLTLAHCQYVAAISAGGTLPLAEIAGILIESNTPRFPADVDSAFPQLFAGLSARGSKVTWAVPPPHPDLGWARLQLFATKPDYADRFAVFLNDLRGGARLPVAESNAFGRDSKSLEDEAAAYFAHGNFQSVTISARPLDPKRDFGEHSLDPALAGMYLADTKLKTDPQSADRAYKDAAEAGYRALAQEGFALLVGSGGGDAREYLDGAISAGSKSAWVYVQAAENRPGSDATAMLKTARELNPKWWLPPAKLAQLANTPAEKESLLAEACAKNPRSAELWQALAEVQSKEGKGIAAQNTWIKASDAAATPAGKALVEQRREQLENQRLDAEEKAQKDAESARIASEQKAQDDQMARIHAAEQRANEANAGVAQPAAQAPKLAEGNVVPWWNQEERPLEGTLFRVDCLDRRARIWVRQVSGKALALLVQDPSHVADGGDAKFGCGVQRPTRRIGLTYKSRADQQLGTVGDVVAIHFE